MVWPTYRGFKQVAGRAVPRLTGPLVAAVRHRHWSWAAAAAAKGGFYSEGADTLSHFLK